MTKASVRLSERELKRRSREGRRDLTGFWLLGGAAVITIILIVLTLRPAASTVALIDGVVEYNNLARGHSGSAQRYQQSPAVGGIHDPTWQNCGIYDKALRNENAVHSLEHGAVWITYQPALSADSVEYLRSLARGHAAVLLSPYPDLTKPVVANAWGLQLPLDDPRDSRLQLFIARYENGPQTPEPGAVCTGGIGTPIEK
jgi:hypothetical protein